MGNTKLFKSVLCVIMCFCLITQVFSAGMFSTKAKAMEDVPYERRTAEMPESILNDSGFENYSNAQNLKTLENDDKWYGISDSGTDVTWISTTVSNSVSHSGSQSLRLYCMYNGAYRKVTGLEKNTDYSFGFYYYLPAYNDNDVTAARTFSVIKGSTSKVTYTGSNDTLARNTHSGEEAKGTGTWKYENLNFNTGDETEVYLFFSYNAKAGSSIGLFIDDLCLAKAKDCLPYYDSDLGSVNTVVENGKLSMTAEPFCSSFRGWYKDGIEVSKDLTISGVTQAEACLYSAVFYSFNCIDDGNFEQYPNEYDMRTEPSIAKWLPWDESRTWQTAKISTNFAKSGTKSLDIYSIYNAMYRKLPTLEANTQYKLSFWYTFNAPAGDYNPGYLEAAYISYASSQIGESAAPNANAVNSKFFNAATGTTKPGEWKCCELTFCTDSVTDYQLSIKYAGENGANIHLYIDDLSLVKDLSSHPDYSNENFENPLYKNWNIVKNFSLNRVENGGRFPSKCGNYVGKAVSTTTGRTAYSKPALFKKGYEYNVSFDVCLVDYPQYTAATRDSDNKIESYFDFKIVGSNTYSDILYDSSYGIKSTVSFTASNETTFYSTKRDVPGYCCARETFVKNGKYDYSTDFVRININFVSPVTKIGYFAFANNEAGTVYLDNLQINEKDGGGADSIIEYDGMQTVGSSIRIKGVQGIRQKTRINKSLLCTNDFGITVKEYGTVTMRADYLNSPNDLVLNGKYTKNNKTLTAVKGVSYSFNDKIDLRYDETDNYIEYTGVLINIPESGYVRDYIIRGYVIYNDSKGAEHIYYTDTVNTSIYKVAKVAYTARNSDKDFAESESTRNYLYNDILSKKTDNSITVKNASPVITNDFQGINATVYHAFATMKDNLGRNYTDEQVAIEMDRLKDSGITTVRSAFFSRFAWNSSKGWDWDSADMNAVYKWANMLNERGIDVAFSAGWHMNYFTFPKYDYDEATKTGERVTKGEHDASILEVDYLYGAYKSVDAGNYNADSYVPRVSRAVYADRYGESVGVDFSGLSDYEKRIKRASLRYGEWMAQALEAFKARGINNIDYLLTFTEPSYATADVREGYYAEEFMTLTAGLNTKLKEHSVRKNIKIVGPNQGSINTGDGLLKYYLVYCQSHPEAEEYIDILTAHMYPKSSSKSIYETEYYHDSTKSAYVSYKATLDTYNTKNKKFWIDEYFASSPLDADCTSNNGVISTQLAAGYVAAINTGLERVLTWQIFDQLWVNQTSTNSEFIGGVHAVGTCPSFTPNVHKDYLPYASQTPRTHYYGLNLLGKYISGKKCIVYNCENDSDSGLYTAAIKRDDGQYAVLVINTTAVPNNVSVKFDYLSVKNVSRYLYDPNGVVQTPAATSIPKDKVIENVDSSGFYDTVAPYSFAIYLTSELKPSEDVDIDVGVLDD